MTIVDSFRFLAHSHRAMFLMTCLNNTISRVRCVSWRMSSTLGITVDQCRDAQLMGSHRTQIKANCVFQVNEEKIEQFFAATFFWAVEDIVQYCYT